MKFSPALAGVFALASTTMAKSLIPGPDAQEPNTRKSYYKDGDLKLIFKNTLPDSVELIMNSSSDDGYQFPRGYSFGEGNNNETVLAGQTLTLGAPVGWLGIIAINDYDKGTKLEGNWLSPDEFVWFDVSYVDGYSAPLTCKAVDRYDNTETIRGCNIDLWELAEKTGNSCPHVDKVTTQLGNNVDICYNRGYSGCGKYANAAHPFFKKCQGLAYTWPYDDLATFGSHTDALECCIGPDCPADNRVVNGKAPWHGEEEGGDEDHTPAKDNEDNEDQDEDDHHHHEDKDSKKEQKQKEKDEKKKLKQNEKEEKKKLKQKEKEEKKEQKQKEKGGKKEQKQKEKDRKKAEKEDKKKAKEATKEKEKAEKKVQKEVYRKFREGEKAQKSAEKEDHRKKKELKKAEKEAQREADKKAKKLEKEILKQEKAFRKGLEGKEREAKKEALRRYREDRKSDRQTLKDRLLAEWDQAETDRERELEEWRRERREREHAKSLSWEVADLDDWCHGVGREDWCGSS